MTFQYSQQIHLHHLGTTRRKLGDWIWNLNRTKFEHENTHNATYDEYCMGILKAPKSPYVTKKPFREGCVWFLVLLLTQVPPGFATQPQTKSGMDFFWGKLNQKSQGQLRHALHGSEIHRKGPATKRMFCVFCP